MKNVKKIIYFNYEDIEIVIMYDELYKLMNNYISDIYHFVKNDIDFLSYILSLNISEFQYNYYLHDLFEHIDNGNGENYDRNGLTFIVEDVVKMVA